MVIYLKRFLFTLALPYIPGQLLYRASRLGAIHKLRISPDKSRPDKEYARLSIPSILEPYLDSVDTFQD